MIGRKEKDFLREQTLIKSQVGFLIWDCGTEMKEMNNNEENAGNILFVV